VAKLLGFWPTRRRCPTWRSPQPASATSAGR